MAKFDASLDK